MGSWSKIKIGNVCQITKGEQFNKIELEKSGDYPCINGGIEPSGYTDKWNTESDTITISEGGNSCGYVNFIRSRFWSGGHCYSLLNLKDNIDKNYLYQALKGREKSIMGLRVGSGLPNIQRKSILGFEIDFPESKPKQSKIAEILSTVDRAIEQTEALIAKQQRIKNGLMQDLLSKGIDEQGNIRSEETHRFKDSPLGRIPVEWEVVTLGEKKLFELATGGTPSTLKKEYWENGSIPWLSSGEVHKKFIYDTENYITERGYKNSNARYYPIDSIIIALAGQGKTRGTVALTKSKITSNQSVAAIIPYKKQVSSLFVYYYLSSKYYDLRSISAGAGRAGLSLNILSNYPIILPKKNEQERISKIFWANEKLILKENISLNKKYKLKTALMQDLLTGKVRVTKLLEKEAETMA